MILFNKKQQKYYLENNKKIQLFSKGGTAITEEIKCDVFLTEKKNKQKCDSVCGEVFNCSCTKAP